MSQDSTAITAPAVNRGMIAEYIQLLFGYIEEGTLAVRSFGEEGTDSKGRPGEFDWIDLSAGVDAAIDRVISVAERNAGTSMATYIIPFAVRAPGAGRHADVTQAAVLVADFDCDDPKAALAHAEAAIGKATLLVASGGISSSGAPKMHAYWELNEVTDQIEELVTVQHMLAAKADADVHFGIGRAHQPIRVPGSIHGKNGVHRLCSILHQRADAEIDLGDACEAVEAMRSLSGEPVSRSSLSTSNSDGTASIQQTALGGYDFSARPPAMIEDHLAMQVHAGGEPDGRTRFNAMTAVIGFNLRKVSDGLIDEEDAWRDVVGWNLANCVPPLEEGKLRIEFAALQRREIEAAARRAERASSAAAQPPVQIMPPEQKAAPTPTPVQPAPPLQLVTKDYSPALDLTPEGVSTPEQAQQAEEENPLLKWAACNWAMGEPPPREFLIEGLVPKGAMQLIAAEGGAGKSTVMLDLAVKLAAAGNRNPAYRDEPLDWMGRRVVQGGTAVVLTAEDDKDEVHRRLRASCGEDGRMLTRAGQRLIPLPLLDVTGGAFPLVHVGMDGVEKPSAQFAYLLEHLAKIDDLAIVVIDTLASTLHGDENNGAVIQQWMRAASRINAMGAAVMVTHHVRKPGQDPIKTAAQMRDAVRGSGSILNSVRSALGIWHADDYAKRMKGMSLTPRRNECYRMAVIKTNNPESSKRTQTLIRNETGGFDDRTASDVMIGASDEETRGWLALAIEEAAKGGDPYTKSGNHGIYDRRGELPPEIRNLGRGRVHELIEEAIGAKVIIRTPKGMLDVPEGRFAGGLDKERTDSSYQSPNWAEWYFDRDIGRPMKDFALMT